MAAPFLRYLVAPLPGHATEHRAPGGAWCFELERGAQHGVRLAFDSKADRLSSVPFDAPGVSVPGNGSERFYLHWPADADSTRSLELTAWMVPGRYERLAGNEKALPLVHVYQRATTSPGAGGSTTYGPFTNAPIEQLGDGSHLRLSRGARLVVECGGSIGAVGTMDARIEEDIAGAGVFRMIDGKRGTGVPSLPAGELLASFDRPLPLHDFRVVVAYSADGTIWTSIYALLGP